MSAQSQLYDALNAASGVRAWVGIVSSPQESRIYPEIAPEDVTLPYICFYVVSNTRLSTIGGVGDPARTQVQISCYAANYDDAQALGDAVYAALEGDGYLELRFDSFDFATRNHVVSIDWNFID